MSIRIKPTRIRETMYLLVPKGVADLAEISAKTKFELHLKHKGTKRILEFSAQ